MSLKSALWKIYFKPRSWERSGSIYRALGVHKIKEVYFYGRYYNAVVGAIRGRKYRPFQGPRWLHHCFAFTFVAEIGHAAIALFLIGYEADRLARGRVAGCLSTFFANIIVNLYPIMAQRYNRARLIRVIRPKFD